VATTKGSDAQPRLLTKPCPLPPPPPHATALQPPGQIPQEMGAMQRQHGVVDSALSGCNSVHFTKMTAAFGLLTSVTLHRPTIASATLFISSLRYTHRRLHYLSTTIRPLRRAFSTRISKFPTGCLSMSARHVRPKLALNPETSTKE
jgi:hypothetical protein